MYLAVAVALALARGVSGEKLADFLFENNRWAASVEKSIRIAQSEKDRILELTRQVPGAAVFLPTDAAWDAMPGAFEALMEETTGNIRYDTLLASSAAIPTGAVRDVQGLRQFTENHQGIVDSAYGTSYTMKGRDQICDYNWTGRDYEVGDCARITNDGVSLEDATVFYIDKLLLPEDVAEDVKALIEMRRRRRRR